MLVEHKGATMPKTDGFLHGVPCWVDLLATDLDAAKDFYAGLFGWEWVGVEMPRGTYWMGTISGETVAGLAAQTPQLVAQGIPSTWNTYISVKSANDTTAKAQAAGATVIQGPMDIPDAGRMAFIADPVGAAFGIWQAGEHKGAGFVKEHGTLIWSEVYAADTEAAVAFYGEVFGWERGSMPMPGGGSYTTFKLGDELVGGTMSPPMEQVPLHWHVWFGSNDTEATVATAAELGATVLVEPTETPAGTIASLHDPVGAAFSVITLTQYVQ